MLICGVLSAPGPAFDWPCRARARGQVVSQLLTGTRNGPGGSPDAARVPSLRSQARGRRTPSRLTNASRNAPSVDEVASSLSASREAGIISFDPKWSRHCREDGHREVTGLGFRGAFFR